LPDSRSGCAGDRIFGAIRKPLTCNGLDFALTLLLQQNAERSADAGTARARLSMPGVCLVMFSPPKFSTVELVVKGPSHPGAEMTSSALYANLAKALFARIYAKLLIHGWGRSSVGWNVALPSYTLSISLLIN
jgi:hypothetical protein